MTRPGDRLRREWDVDEPDDPEDENVTQADRDAEADRAADRYERHMWGDG